MRSRTMLAAAEAWDTQRAFLHPEAYSPPSHAYLKKEGNGWEGQDKVSARRLAVPEMCLISLVNSAI
jgi:hypothetical protein